MGEFKIICPRRVHKQSRLFFTFTLLFFAPSGAHPVWQVIRCNHRSKHIQTRPHGKWWLVKHTQHVYKRHIHQCRLLGFDLLLSKCPIYFSSMCCQESINSQIKAVKLLLLVGLNLLCIPGEKAMMERETFQYDSACVWLHRGGSCLHQKCGLVCQQPTSLSIYRLHIY